jgi:GDP-4-dehydro-6-deoxy-D-mannose reductase
MHETIQELMAIAEVNVPIQQDPARLRKSDQRRVCGSNSKIKQATGWTHSIQWHDSLRDILRDWEDKLK